MQPHTRAIIAACAHSAIIGKKVAGIYDHAADQHLQIAAECRGNRIQGVDGERSAKFGGMLPEIYDNADKTFLSLEVDGAKARGYDRGSAGFYAADVTERAVQVFDYSQDTWFSFDVLIAEDGPVSIA
jgi:hypothetical protein